MTSNTDLFVKLSSNFIVLIQNDNELWDWKWNVKDFYCFVVQFHTYSTVYQYHILDFYLFIFIQ